MNLLQPTAMNLALTHAAGWLSGVRAERCEGVAVARVHTDSRTLQAGDLFVALRANALTPTSSLRGLLHKVPPPCCASRMAKPPLAQPDCPP